ncbi:MAG TPA: Ig-like domain-containing protein [Anaerolineales bacterium]|nr:Ig-like domain-containing protein [Anaerolineales bacterium]
MKKNLRLVALIAVVLFLAIALSVSKSSGIEKPENLSVQATPPQAGPQVVAQNPAAGERLNLSPTIQISFDRAMDQEKTGDAFSLLGPDRQPVPGRSAWSDARTFEFTPASRLEPASAYLAVFSTAALARDGTSPAENIQLNFTTVEGLKVGQVFPIADAEDVDAATNITVIFNHPVVPLTIQEEQSSLPQPIELSPPVPGQGQWVNSSVYVFQPDAALLGGIRYTIRVGAGLKDTNGDALDQSYVSQFTTRAPAVANFALKNGEQNPPLDNVQNVLLDQAFVITFLQPMDPDSTAQATTITNRETGKPVSLGFSWNQDLTELTLQPKGRYQIASYYHLQITDAARAQAGGSLKDGLSVSFSTVPLPAIVRVIPEPNSVATSFDSSLSIQFASPMRLDSLKGRVIVTPAPRTALQWYYNDYDHTYNTYGLEAGTSYIVRVLPGMADIYGNAIGNEDSFTFKTADMDPYARLAVPWTPLVYRARGPQDMFFEYMNLDAVRVSLYSLTFEDFSKMSVNGSGDNKGGTSVTNFLPQTPPIREWKLDTQIPRNQAGYVDLKLQDQKENPLAPGYYFMGVTGSPLQYTTHFYQAFVFIVATDNITLKTTASEGLAWVTDLESGQPQADVPVSFYDQDFHQVGTTTATDPNGLVYLKGIDLPVYARVEGSNHLAFVSTTWGSGVWTGDIGIAENFYGSTNAPFVYLYTDRPLYRPGQDVYFKGLVRQNDDLHYSLVKEAQVYVTIEEAGQQVYAKYLPLSQLGSITDDFKLADDAALGTYTIMARTAPSADPFGTLDFRVAEYHKPQFQVGLSADKANVLNGDRLDFGLDATYYSGGNVANADVDWFTEAVPYTFTPDPKYSQFSFMDWDQDQYYVQPQPAGQGGVLEQGKGATDANGHLDLSQALKLGETTTDQQVTLNANVTDVAGDLVSGQTSVIVHQSELYGGIRSVSYVGKQGQAQQFEAVVLDWNSHPVPGQDVTIKFVERQWLSVQKQDSQGQLSWVTSVKDIPLDQKSVRTDSEGKAAVSFVPPEGGVYKAILVVTDPKGNAQQASAYTWVSSSQYISWRETNDRTFNLVADRNMYSPGDTAQLLIAQPFQGSVYALVTYERGHIYKREVVLLNGNSTLYSLPITSDMAPMTYVSVVVVSGAGEAKAPDFKIGLTRINVDTSQQTLDVKVTTDQGTAGPNDSVVYTVTSKDQAGQPVSADVSLAIVDKAVLALAPSNSDPILKGFYPDQGLGVQTALGLVSSADDFNAQYRQSIPAGGGQGGGGGPQTSYGIITVRQNFKDTAFFQAQLTTDANGQARVTVKLPENLTTWVADARAATVDGRVGQATNELVSTKPLFVELQTPRFFIAGDQARIGAVIHNNGAAPLKVNVSLAAQGVQLTTPGTQLVEVAATDQAYVTWDVNVDQDAQRVDLTAQAVSGPFTDSSKPALGTLAGQGLPVYTYTVAEPVGTAGIISSANSVTEAIELPAQHNYTGADLSLQISPSLAASLQDGLTYLQDYPYYCMEQTISSFLPNVVTRRALKLAGLSDPGLQSNLDSQVNSALQRIYAKQLSDGGWNWWDGPSSDPQVSAYVVLGLEEARDSGYPVSQEVLDNGIQYLNQNLPDLYQNAATWQYNRYAFMTYVLARGSVLQAGQTNFIYDQRSALSLYGKAYLAQALYMLDPKDPRLDSLMSDLAAATVMSAAGAHWQEKGEADYWNWNTDTRTTAIVLNAFVQIEPNDPITADAVRWLMSVRGARSWYSTQETSWSLIALTNWLSASGEYQTDYSYAVGLNGNSIYRGAANRANLTQSENLQIQLKDLLKDTANYLVLTRGNGTGNLYYSAYLAVKLAVPSLPPLDQGVSLSRQYFTLDDPKTPITATQRGQVVKVRLTLVVPDDLHYVVINDPLPAGLEAIDASINTDMSVPTKYTLQDYNERGYGWWYFDHTELRDEKVVLSADYLPAGTYVYTYLARASTAGTFNVIPPTASEFYFPDVSGRGAGGQFVVKP